MPSITINNIQLNGIHKDLFAKYHKLYYNEVHLPTAQKSISTFFFLSEWLFFKVLKARKSYHSWKKFKS